MNIDQIRGALDAKVCSGSELLSEEVKSACGSDLMSDVLAFVKERTVLLTGLVNAQVIRTAEMLDMVAVVFVRGKQPSEEILRMADERGIAVLATSHTLFTACGILYAHGLRGEALH